MPKAGMIVVPSAPRRERLAVNLYDVMALDIGERQAVLGGKLDLSSPPEWVDKSRPDETAVVFDCDLLTAACACDLLRDGCRKRGEPPVRVYVFRARAWTKLPGTVSLTRCEGGRVKLNGDVFSVEVERAPYEAPEFRPLF